ncbi:Uncharacterised protein [Mycobacteroides abscessus subsp. abscessus]|nr:Uncharacterised protein [Mycobacteroides abscessus subsp. abscessus]
MEVNELTRIPPNCVAGSTRINSTQKRPTQ